MLPTVLVLPVWRFVTLVTLRCRTIAPTSAKVWPLGSSRFMLRLHQGLYEGFSRRSLRARVDIRETLGER